MHQPTVGLCQTERLVEVFYDDLDPANVEYILVTLRPHAFTALESPAPTQAWAETAFKGRLAFLRCTKDQASPISTQDALMQRSGVEWLVKDVAGSHFALLSQVDDVTQATIDWMELFCGCVRVISLQTYGAFASSCLTSECTDIVCRGCATPLNFGSKALLRSVIGGKQSLNISLSVSPGPSMAFGIVKAIILIPKSTIKKPLG